MVGISGALIGNYVRVVTSVMTSFNVERSRLWSRCIRS